MKDQTFFKDWQTEATCNNCKHFTLAQNSKQTGFCGLNKGTPDWIVTAFDNCDGFEEVN